VSDAWLLYAADDDAPSGEIYIGMVYSFAEVDRKCALAAMRGLKLWARPYSSVVKPENRA